MVIRGLLDLSSLMWATSRGLLLDLFSLVWGSLGLRPLWCSGGSLFLAVPPPLGMQLTRYGAGPCPQNRTFESFRLLFENVIFEQGQPHSGTSGSLSFALLPPPLRTARSSSSFAR